MYVVLHGKDDVTGVKVNGEFKPDNGVYTIDGYYAIFRDLAEVEKFGAGYGHREATDEEIADGALFFDYECGAMGDREIEVV